MSEFQTVGRVGDLADGEGRTVKVGDKLVALFREGDQYYALDDTCPHMGASLSGGHVAGGLVTCPWHAWRFRLHDGAWADYLRVKIGSYQVRIVNDDIQVEVAKPKIRARPARAQPEDSA